MALVIGPICDPNWKPGGKVSDQWRIDLSHARSASGAPRPPLSWWRRADIEPVERVPTAPMTAARIQPL